MSETLVRILTGIGMAVGLAGIFLPVIPGLLLIWAAALGYGLLAGWGSSGPWLFAGITILGLAGTGAELWATGAGARVGGARLTSILAGAALAAVALIFSGPFTAVAALVIGILLAEYYRLRDWRRALNAAGGTAAGCGLSYGFKLLLGGAMIAAWILWLVLG